MGIDHLFVDESHNFKNLMFNTRHSRVSGLGNTDGSKKATNLLFDFRILVRTERMQKDGLALTVNKFMVEGLDGIKYTFNNGHLAAEPKTAATNFIRALDTIPSLMATYEKEKKQFTRDIPTFEQQIAAV